MKPKILIDMNLSPLWVGYPAGEGMEAIHWTAAGAPTAADAAIMDWALAHGWAVFTHDLDFGRLLALSRGKGPSVIQVRGQDVLPDKIGKAVIEAIQKFRDEIEAGALISIDERGMRARALPLR